MEIRPINNKDLIDVERLITDVFMEFEAPDYSEEGVRTFFDVTFNNPDYMNNITIYGAYTKSELVGVVATRNGGNHIALFFVNSTHHRQGIGRQLFEAVLENATSNEITVNSSPYAKIVYQHLGFREAGVEQDTSGIRFTPMIYEKENNLGTNNKKRGAELETVRTF